MTRFALVLFTVITAYAQTVEQERIPPGARGPIGVLLHDQFAIATGPVRLHPRDARWLLPLGGAIAFLATTDRRNMQDRIHPSANLRDRSGFVSNAGVEALASLPVLLSWHGWRTADDYARTTSLMAARAVTDTAVASEAVRMLTRRERPAENGGQGTFFRGSALASSFPSLHAGVAWALASTVAHRYSGWLTQVGVYGLASAVSVSRVTMREHFPSDVLVGSATGWLIGRYVARSGGTPLFHWPESAYAPHPADNSREAASKGSPYVPLDSWIYTALDRLAAAGLIPSQLSGLRPWTRAECRRQLQEADAAKSAPNGTAVLLAALHREFDGDDAISGVVVDKLWMRSGAIAGPLLNDGMHFGQTWRNDSGRPFGRGWNADAGFAAHAQSGRLFASVEGEYQRAPGSEPYSPAVQQTIANLDGVPMAAALGQRLTSRFRTTEAYLGIRLGDLDISVGKQALFWGPGHDSPLSFGDNAEPTKNLKIATDHPVRLPGLLRYLGEIQGEFVIGKLGGQRYTWRPWFNAQKLSFKLTPNLEMGFTRWSIFWGVGHPITVGSFLRNFTSFDSPLGPAGVGRSDPGDRKGGFDFRYRLPGLRDWLTIYCDSYSDDDPSPLANPRHAAINPGLYLTRVPGIPHLDFRVEAPSTQPMTIDRGGLFVYFNNQYRSGNTNYGVPLGNPVGRDGRAIEGWTTYWFGARSKIELGVRQFKASGRFLPGGATQSDGTVKLSLPLADSWYIDAMLQYERFWVPALGGPHHNLSGWLQLAWEPGWVIRL